MKSNYKNSKPKTSCIMDSVKLFVKKEDKFESFTCLECDLSNICGLCYETCHFKCHKSTECLVELACFKQNFCLCALNNHKVKASMDNNKMEKLKTNSRECSLLKLFLDFRPYMVYADSTDNSKVYCNYCVNQYQLENVELVKSSKIKDLFEIKCSMIHPPEVEIPKLTVEEILITNPNNFLSFTNIEDYCIRYLGRVAIVKPELSSHKRFFSIMGQYLKTGDISQLIASDTGTQILNTLEFFRILFKYIVNMNYDFSSLLEYAISESTVPTGVTNTNNPDKASTTQVNTRDTLRSQRTEKLTILDYVFNLKLANELFTHDLNINIKLASIILHILQSQIPNYFIIKNEMFTLSALMKIPITKFEGLVKMSLDEFLYSGFMENFTCMVQRSFHLRNGYIAFNRDSLVNNFFKIIIVILNIRSLSYKRLLRVHELFTVIFSQIKNHNIDVKISLTALALLYNAYLETKVYDVAMSEEQDSSDLMEKQSDAFFQNKQLSDMKNMNRAFFSTSKSVDNADEVSLDSIENNEDELKKPLINKPVLESFDKEKMMYYPEEVDFGSLLAQTLLKFDSENYFCRKLDDDRINIKDILNPKREFYRHRDKDVVKFSIRSLLTTFQSNKRGILQRYLEFLLRPELKNCIINLFSTLQPSAKKTKDTLWKGVIDVRSRFYFNDFIQNKFTKTKSYFENEENYLEDILRQTDTVKIFFENSEETYIYHFVERHLMEYINLFEYICNYKGCSERIDEIKLKIIFSILKLFELITKTSGLFALLFIKIKDIFSKLLFSCEDTGVIKYVFSIFDSSLGSCFKGEYDKKLHLDLTQLFKFINCKNESLFSPWSEYSIRFIRKIGIVFNKTHIKGYEQGVIEFIISKIPELSVYKPTNNKSDIMIIKNFVMLILYMDTQSFVKMKDFISPKDNGFSLINLLLQILPTVKVQSHDFNNKILNLFTKSNLVFPFYLNMEIIVENSVKKNKDTSHTFGNDKLKQLQYKESFYKERSSQQIGSSKLLLGSKFKQIGRGKSEDHSKSKKNEIENKNLEKINSQFQKMNLTYDNSKDPLRKTVRIEPTPEVINFSNLNSQSNKNDNENNSDAKNDDKCNQILCSLDTNFNFDNINKVSSDLLIKHILSFKEKITTNTFNELIEEYKEFILKSMFSILHFFLYQLTNSTCGDDKLYVANRLTIITASYLRDIMDKIDINNTDHLKAFCFNIVKKFNLNYEKIEAKKNPVLNNKLNLKDKNQPDDYELLVLYINEIKKKTRLHLKELQDMNILRCSFKILFDILNFYFSIFLDFENSRKISKRGIVQRSLENKGQENKEIVEISSRNMKIIRNLERFYKYETEVRMKGENSFLSNTSSLSKTYFNNIFYIMLELSIHVNYKVDIKSKKQKKKEKRKQSIDVSDDGDITDEDRNENLDVIEDLPPITDRTYQNLNKQATYNSNSNFNNNNNLVVAGSTFKSNESNSTLKQVYTRTSFPYNNNPINENIDNLDNLNSLNSLNANSNNIEQLTFDNAGGAKMRVSMKSSVDTEDYNSPQNNYDSKENSNLQIQPYRSTYDPNANKFKQAKTIVSNKILFANTNQFSNQQLRGQNITQINEKIEEKGEIDFSSLETLLSLAQTESYYQFLQSKMVSNSTRFAPKLIYLIENEIPNLLQMFIIGFKSSKYDENVLPKLANSIEFVRLHCEGYNKYFKTLITYFKIKLPDGEFITFAGLIMKFYSQILQITRQYLTKIKTFQVNKIFFKDLNTLVDCSKILVNFLIELTQGNFDYNFVELYSKDKFFPITFEICGLITLVLSNYADPKTYYILKMIEEYLKLLSVILEEYQTVEFASGLLDLINFREICYINYFSYLCLLREMKFLNDVVLSYDNINLKDCVADSGSIKAAMKRRSTLMNYNDCNKENSAKLNFNDDLLNEENRKTTYSKIGFSIGCISYQIIKLYCFINSEDSSWEYYLDIPTSQGTFRLDEIRYLKFCPLFFNIVVKSVEISVLKDNFFNNQDFSDYADYFQKEKLHPDYENIFKEIRKPEKDYKKLMKIFFVIPSDGFYYDEMKSIYWVFDNIVEDYTENLKKLLIYSKSEFKKELSIKKTLYQKNKIEHFQRYDNYMQNEQISMYIAIVSNLILISSMKVRGVDNRIGPSLFGWILLTLLNLIQISWCGYCIYIYYHVKSSCALDKALFKSTWYSITKITQSNRTKVLVFSSTLAVLSLFGMPYLLPFQLFMVYRFSITIKNIMFAIKVKFMDFMSALLLIAMIVLLFASFSVYYYNSEITNEEGEQVCKNFFSCFFHLCTNGVRTGSGFNFPIKSYEDNDFWKEFVADWMFYFILILVMANIINAIIVDLFQKLSDQEAARMDFLTRTCMMCGYNDEDFKMKKINYESHIVTNHHIYFYLQYFHYLKTVKDIDLSRANSSVKKMIEADNITFFPTKQTAGLNNKIN